jgi:hypothetical protein
VGSTGVWVDVGVNVSVLVFVLVGTAMFVGV